MKVEIQYFAELRQQAQRDNEILDISEPDAKVIYTRLQEKYGFHSDWHQLGLAVNHQMARWDHSLQNGDVIVFIPKVAGG